MKTYSTFDKTFFNVLNAQDKRMVKCLEMLSVLQRVQGSNPIKFTSQQEHRKRGKIRP